MDLSPDQWLTKILCFGFCFFIIVRLLTAVLVQSHSRDDERELWRSSNTTTCQRRCFKTFTGSFTFRTTDAQLVSVCSLLLAVASTWKTQTRLQTFATYSLSKRRTWCQLETETIYLQSKSCSFWNVLVSGWGPSFYFEGKPSPRPLCDALPLGRQLAKRVSDLVIKNNHTEVFGAASSLWPLSLGQSLWLRQALLAPPPNANFLLIGCPSQAQGVNHRWAELLLSQPPDALMVHQL